MIAGPPDRLSSPHRPPGCWRRQTRARRMRSPKMQKMGTPWSVPARYRSPTGHSRVSPFFAFFRVSYQARQPAGAVADAVLLNAIQLENAQQKIPAGDGFGRIRQVTVPLHLAGFAADQNVRHVVLQVLIGCAHLAALDSQRTIDQRA